MWDMTDKTQKMSTASEMDYLRQSRRATKLDKIRNHEMRTRDVRVVVFEQWKQIH